MMIFFFFLFMFIFFMMMFIMIIPSNFIKFNPLMMNFFLVVYTIVICFKLNFFMMSYWFSYVLFLVMIGGLMILFMYFTSLASNQLFYMKFNFKIYLFLKLIFLFMFILILLFYKDFFMNLFMLDDSFEVYNFIYIYKNMYKNLYMNLMMDFCMDINFYMIFYLFLTMVSVVLICFKSYLPLRQLLKN